MSKLMTAFGAPVPDNQNTQTAAPRGPTLLQDVWPLEKLAARSKPLSAKRRASFASRVDAFAGCADQEPSVSL